MRFSVCHETLYRYSGPVRLASHVLRLSPRPGGAVSVARSLTVDPTPTVRREVTDRFGPAAVALVVRPWRPEGGILFGQRTGHRGSGFRGQAGGGKRMGAARLS